jgi:hypothetical protein
VASLLAATLYQGSNSMAVTYIVYFQAKKAVMEYNLREEKKKNNHWNPWFMRGKRSVPREWYYDGTAAKNIFEVKIVSMNKNVYFFYCNCWFIKSQMSSNFSCIYIAMR